MVSQEIFEWGINNENQFSLYKSQQIDRLFKNDYKL